MKYPIIDVTDWLVDTEKGEGKGLREKVWLINPSTSESAMFKIPRENRGEHWAEKLCSEIANILDFNCARVDLAKRGNTYGSLSYFFVDKNNGFSHFDGGTYFPFDYDDERNIGYNVQLIKKVLDEQNISFGEFLFIIIFDALVANGDRHQDNWGITRHDIEDIKFISPLYDNSACLGRDLNEVSINKYCDSNEDLLRYIYKGKAKIGWGDIRNENHFALIRKILKLFPLRTLASIDRLSHLTDVIIENIINKLPNEVITEKHKEFVKLFLIKRRDILKRIGDSMVNTVNELLLIWKDPVSRQRFTVGKLMYNELTNIYRFIYLNPDLNDAIQHGFKNYPNFPFLSHHYEVNGSLFKDIRSRLPQPRRPDYAEILERYGLDSSSSEMEVLEATRGRTATDNFEFVKDFKYIPNNSYDFTFDLAGARYNKFSEITSDLKINDSIELQKDIENEHDHYAVKVLAKGVHIGFVPKYYSMEFTKMIEDNARYTATVSKLDIQNASPDEWSQIRVKINVL
ncbi:HIRAN domain-containing protein [Bacillus sp. JJ1532]|uniref:HIRAN domain-containing protein n=1 Tax=Bacillus sp. JJ1532 TaxID=3122958 RepID=UPI0030001CDC